MKKKIYFSAQVIPSRNNGRLIGYYLYLTKCRQFNYCPRNKEGLERKNDIQDIISLFMTILVLYFKPDY